VPCVKFFGQLFESVFAAGNKNQMHASCGELSRKLSPDPGRRSGNQSPAICVTLNHFGDSCDPTPMPARNTNDEHKVEATSG
jgi:hypothetical protein